MCFVRPQASALCAVPKQPYPGCTIAYLPSASQVASSVVTIRAIAPPRGS